MKFFKTTLFNKLFGRKQEPSGETTDLVGTLQLLAEAEANLSTFYRLCADAHPEGKDLWTSMAVCESGHAEGLRKMAALVSRSPERYRLGYVFNATSVRLFSLHMEVLAQKMRTGQIAPEKLFSIADEIEKSAIELNIARLIETDDEECSGIARRIDDESREHRKVLKKIARVREQNISLETP